MRKPEVTSSQNALRTRRLSSQVFLDLASMRARERFSFHSFAQQNHSCTGISASLARPVDANEISTVLILIDKVG